jgi:hypothetical protein
MLPDILGESDPWFLEFPNKEHCHEGLAPDRKSGRKLRRKHDGLCQCYSSRIARLFGNFLNSFIWWKLDICQN